MSKKIYHIHTDFKFLYDSQRFESELFENQLIFIGEKVENNAAYHDSAIFYPNSEQSVPAILKVIEDADLVVLYDLCDFKKELLKKMPPQIKVAWRFFGYEYYGTRRDLMLTKKTLDIVENRKKFKSAIFYKLNLFLKLRKRRYLDSKDLEVVKKIDYILLFSNEEYLYLKKYWNVPQLVLLNLDFHFDETYYNKTDSLIIGNSRNIYNNHIDILDIIIRGNFKKYIFNFFLSYGAKGAYFENVTEIAQKEDNINLITDFLSKDNFEHIYTTSAALVINSHRQMALGNIFTAVKYGLKIYLNDKNAIKNWLTANGIMISSVSDLKKDLTENNIKLTYSEMISNIKNFNRISEVYTKEMFCSKINKLL